VIFIKTLPVPFITIYCITIIYISLILNFCYRRQEGLFRDRVFMFPGKCCPVKELELSSFSPLVVPNDLLSDKVNIKGTDYRVGQVLVTKIVSADILEVGTVVQIVMRQSSVMFLLTHSEAVRAKLGYFETLPSNTVILVKYEDLADYKPLIKRGGGSCFPFVLHHHIPSPLIID